MKLLLFLLFAVCFALDAAELHSDATLSGTTTFADGSNLNIGSGVIGQWPPTNGGTGIASFAAGDLLFASGASTLARLPKGSDGQVLTIDATSHLPKWSTPATPTMPTVVAFGDFPGLTDAIQPLASYQTDDDGTTHTFRVNAYANILAVSSTTLQVRVSWTDESGATRLIALIYMGKTTAALNAVGFFGLPPLPIRCAPNTTITIDTMVNGASITYDAGSVIELLK